jgi:hypothetical protein
MPRAHHHEIRNGKLRLVRPPVLHKERDAVWKLRGNKDLYDGLPADIQPTPNCQWLDGKQNIVRVEVDHVADLQVFNVALPQTDDPRESYALFDWFADHASRNAQLNVTSKTLNTSKGGVVKGWLALADDQDEKKMGRMTFDNLRDRLSDRKAAGDVVARNVTREMARSFDAVVTTFKEDDRGTRSIKGDQRDDVVVKLWRWRDEHLTPMGLM